MVDRGLGWQVLVDFVGFVVCCDVWRCCGGGSVGLVWVFGWFSVVCRVNGDGSWCFTESMGCG